MSILLEAEIPEVTEIVAEGIAKGTLT